MNPAAENGHMDVVKWLHENRREGCTTDAMKWAAGNGRLDILKWLYERKPRKDGCTGDAMIEAAKNGHLKIVQWLYEHDFPKRGVSTAPYASLKSTDISISSSG